MVAKLAVQIRRTWKRLLPERSSQMGITIRVEPDVDDGGFVASVVGVPGVRSQGETEIEAVHNAIDALMCFVRSATAPMMISGLAMVSHPAEWCSPIQASS